MLLPLGNSSVLQYVVDRTSLCKEIDEIWLATTCEPQDDALYSFASEIGINCLRGSTDDVLDRYFSIAQITAADGVLRITADCPFIDPNILSDVVRGFKTGLYDYFGLGGYFPDGLDCSIYSRSALEIAWRNAVRKSDREHVGPFIEGNPDNFRLGSLTRFTDPKVAEYRWTIDEEVDYEFLKTVLLHLTDKLHFNSDDVISVLTRNPELVKINSHIVRNEGYLISLREESK